MDGGLSISALRMCKLAVYGQKTVYTKFGTPSQLGQAMLTPWPFTRHLATET